MFFSPSQKRLLRALQKANVGLKELNWSSEVDDLFVEEDVIEITVNHRFSLLHLSRVFWRHDASSSLFRIVSYNDELD